MGVYASIGFLPSHPFEVIWGDKKHGSPRRTPLWKNKKTCTMLAIGVKENSVENVIASYESRIQNVEALFETTHQILHGLQESVLDTRQEREKVNKQLRETLAKNGSLRKKDFDSMISVISSHQDQEEREVRDLSKNYLSEQTDLVHQLRERLKQFRDALAKGEAQRVKEFEIAIKEIFAEQERRKEEVIAKLKEFQKEQQETAKMLKSLLAKGRELRTRDLKLMLADFKKQREERIACQQERRQEVQNLLGEFKAERAEVAQGLLAAQQNT